MNSYLTFVPFDASWCRISLAEGWVWATCEVRWVSFVAQCLTFVIQCLKFVAQCLTFCCPVSKAYCPVSYARLLNRTASSSGYQRNPRCLILCQSFKKWSLAKVIIFQTKGKFSWLWPWMENHFCLHGYCFQPRAQNRIVCSLIFKSIHFHCELRFKEHFGVRLDVSCLCNIW